MPEVSVRMPKYSMAQEEGQLLTWAKEEGDTIDAGETLCEVATDKVNMEVESPFGGTILKLLAAPNQTVPVGEPIAIVVTESDDLLDGLFDGPAGPDGAANDQPVGDPPAAATTEAHTADPGPVSVATGADTTAVPPSRKSLTPAMPGARRRAAALGVDLSTLSGSGREGAVTLSDVEAAASTTAESRAPEAKERSDAHAEQPAATATPATVDQSAERAAAPPPNGNQQPATPGIDPGYADAIAERRRTIRAAVAKRMAESAAVPQFTLFADLDLDRLRGRRRGIGWTTLWTWALGRVLRRYPELNVLWLGDGARPQDRPGVSLAVDTPVGLLAPVIPEPDASDLDELDATVRRTIDRARTGRLNPADLDGGTITLSNLGRFGVHSFQALVTPPQVAVLSVGAIAHCPVVHHGGLASRLQCRVGLTVDHRVADGADASRFLADLREELARTVAVLDPPVGASVR